MSVKRHYENNKKIRPRKEEYICNIYYQQRVPIKNNQYENRQSIRKRTWTVSLCKKKYIFNEYMKRCSTSFVIREIQMKSTRNMHPNVNYGL